MLALPVGREVLLFPLRKVELGQILGVNIPTSSGDSCTWPEMTPKWSCCVDFLEPIQEMLESRSPRGLCVAWLPPILIRVPFVT